MIVMSPIRCPHCLHKLLERLDGVAEVTCRHCKRRVILDSRVLSKIE